MLLCDPCRGGGAVPILQVRRVRLQAQTEFHVRVTGSWGLDRAILYPPQRCPPAFAHLSPCPFSSWTLPQPPHCGAPAVLPPGGSAGRSPKLGTEALFPEDQLPLPGGARGTIPPGPRPVLLVDFTNVSGFCWPSLCSLTYCSPVALAPVVLSPDDTRSPGPITEPAGSHGTFQGEHPHTPTTSGLVSKPFYPGKPVSRLLQDALNEWPYPGLTSPPPPHP